MPPICKLKKKNRAYHFARLTDHETLNYLNNGRIKVHFRKFILISRMVISKSINQGMGCGHFIAKNIILVNESMEYWLNDIH